MAHLTVTVKLTNYLDMALARHGHVASDEVRSCEVEAVVDTDEMLMGLPEELVEELGLSPFPTITMWSPSTGARRARRATTLCIDIGDRLTHMDCEVLPRGAQPRAGRIVLGMMDLVLDEGRGCLAPGHPDADGPVYYI